MVETLLRALYRRLRAWVGPRCEACWRAAPVHVDATGRPLCRTHYRHMVRQGWDDWRAYYEHLL